MQMKQKKPQRLIPNKKKIAEKVQKHHKQITLSDLDEYELILYRELEPLFKNNTLNGLENSLNNGCRLVAEKYILNNTGDEEFTIEDEVWNDLYLEAFLPFLDTYVPDVTKTIRESTDTSPNRLLSIVVTETTRITATTGIAMQMVYNHAIDLLYT
jgi:hypothetical protein